MQFLFPSCPDRSRSIRDARIPLGTYFRLRSSIHEKYDFSYLCFSPAGRTLRNTSKLLRQSYLISRPTAQSNSRPTRAAETQGPLREARGGPGPQKLFLGPWAPLGSQGSCPGIRAGVSPWDPGEASSPMGPGPPLWPWGASRPMGLKDPGPGPPLGPMGGPF